LERPSLCPSSNLLTVRSNIKLKTVHFLADGARIRTGHNIHIVGEPSHAIGTHLGEWVNPFISGGDFPLCGRILLASEGAYMVDFELLGM